MVQTLSPTFATLPIYVPTASSNVPTFSVEENPSMTDVDRSAVNSTQDSNSIDGHCFGLAEIQICAINCFSAHSNISVPTDVHMLD